jgi:hypothetical protein
MRWPKRKEMIEVMVGFKCFCGLPFVHGAIDVTQIHIQEPKGTFFGFFFQVQIISHATMTYC